MTTEQPVKATGGNSYAMPPFADPVADVSSVVSQWIDSNYTTDGIPKKTLYST